MLLLDVIHFESIPSSVWIGSFPARDAVFTGQLATFTLVRETDELFCLLAQWREQCSNLWADTQTDVFKLFSKLIEK